MFFYQRRLYSALSNVIAIFADERNNFIVKLKIRID